MFSKVLVPMDGSELGEGVLPYVTELAKSHGSSVLFLSVLGAGGIRTAKQLIPGDPMIQGSGDQREGFMVVDAQPEASESPGTYASQLEELAQEEAAASLRSVVERMEGEGVQAEAMATFGRPEAEIVATAERQQCDLIVMATHARGTLGRLLLGSVTEKVINSSPIPTLVVNPSATRAAAVKTAESAAGAGAVAHEPAEKTAIPAVKKAPAGEEEAPGRLLVEEPVGTLEILLVEDNPGDVRLTEEGLKDSGIDHRLTVAGDGEHAMAILRNPDAPRPDVVLLDLGLPKMSGQEVLAKIRSDADLKLVPVIILTMSRSEEDILRSYDLQANNYLVKPLQSEHLSVVVDAVQDYLRAISRIKKGEAAQV